MTRYEQGTTGGDERFCSTVGADMQNLPKVQRSRGKTKRQAKSICGRGAI